MLVRQISVFMSSSRVWEKHARDLLEIWHWAILGTTKLLSGSQRTWGFGWRCVCLCVCVCVTAVQLALSRSVCQSVCRVRGHARCIWNLWADGRRAWLSHRCSTWLIDAGLFEVLSGRMNSIHKPLHPPHCWPHLSLLSLHSVNSWNATLLRAHSGMKLRWTDSSMIGSLRMFSICVELQLVVALTSRSSHLNTLCCVWRYEHPLTWLLYIHWWG